MVIQIFTFPHGFCHISLKCRYGYHSFIFSTNQKLVYVHCMKHHTISSRFSLLTPFLIPIHPSLPLSYLQVFSSPFYLSHHTLSPLFTPTPLTHLFTYSFPQFVYPTLLSHSSHSTISPDFLYLLPYKSFTFFLPSLSFHSLSHSLSPFLNLISSTHRSLSFVLYSSISLSQHSLTKDHLNPLARID